MCLVFRCLAITWLFVSSNLGTETNRVLRIAADPNNLPFSNDRLEGFENRIATLLAEELGVRIDYVWHAQRRGFFREAVRQGDCDLVMGVPARFERLLTSKPYYRSSYMFVSRSDRNLNLGSLDDPILRALKIGVHLIGDDGMNTPPVHALTDRGIVTNLFGFTLYGDYSKPNPPARIIEAVSKGEIDVALVWGPLAGYFAIKETTGLTLSPLSGGHDLPFTFEISVGIHKSQPRLRDQIDEILSRRKKDIQTILREYRIPLDTRS
jgi:mxaJ protein